MKAARFHARRDVRVDDVPNPSDIRPDEVLVRNAFCGICGSDLHEYAMGRFLFRRLTTLFPAHRFHKFLDTNSVALSSLSAGT